MSSAANAAAAALPRVGCGAARDGHVLDPAAGEVDVLGVEVVPDVPATVLGGGDERRARTHERVEHEVVLVGVQEDQALGERDGERRRVLHALGALRRQVPDVEGRGHELVGVDRRASTGSRQRSRSRSRSRPVEASLARDHDPLGDVAQHRVRRLAERAPRAVPGRADVADALAPDDLAAQQQAEVVLQDPDHVGREAPVRLAAEVRDVDRDAPARLERRACTRRRRR